MNRILCRSKIHRATVTDADLNYEGSITIDPELLEAADIHEFEQVQVANLSTGCRFDTYALAGKRGSGQVVVNGAAARMVQPGDVVAILCYVLVEESELDGFQPRFVHVDETNQIREISRGVA